MKRFLRHFNIKIYSNLQGIHVTINDQLSAAIEKARAREKESERERKNIYDQELERANNTAI